MKGDFYLGNEHAKVTIIEYDLFSCPACSKFHDKVFPNLKEDYIDSGKVLFISRPLPFGGSLEANALCACEKDNDKYFKLRNALFETVNSWNGSVLQDRKLCNIGILSGMTSEKAKECINDESVQQGIIDKINISREQGIDISSAPTFLINGKVYKGFISYERLQSILKDLL